MDQVSASSVLGHLHIGLDVLNGRAVPSLIDLAQSSDCDYVVSPLCRAAEDKEKQVDSDRSWLPHSKADTLLSAQSWSNYVVGRLENGTVLELDSLDDSKRKESERKLSDEVHWASYLGLPAVLVPAPKMDGKDLCCTNFARTVQALCAAVQYIHIWIEFALESQCKGPYTSWDQWRMIHTLCDFRQDLCPVLVLSDDLPEDKTTIDRWLGEPLKAVILPTSIFMSNKAGYPVLTSTHQDLLRDRLMLMKVQFIIRGDSDSLTVIPEDSEVDDERKSAFLPYAQYIRWIYQSMRPFSRQQQFEVPYHDYLQSPLQPLMNHLHSGTYEVFEKDPVKYDQYEEAIKQAFKDQVSLKKESGDTEPILLMVAGAGRGPLVLAAQRAANSLGLSAESVEFIALEKNPSAVRTIEIMRRDKKFGEYKVDVVSSDMRSWNSPRPVDILVSELLGSFGDNELSPECLDGAQRFLRRPSGVSIPTSYTSYLAPLSSAKLWADVKSLGRGGHKLQKEFETSYVCSVFNCFQIAPPQSVFVFHHPNFSSEEKIDNSRFTRLSFTATATETMHGFVGYFDSDLYNGVFISTLPSTASKEMFSWFPIYFPLRTPIPVKEGEEIEVFFWRRDDGKAKVWYEWCTTKPYPSSIHNPNGRSHWIGL